MKRTLFITLLAGITSSIAFAQTQAPAQAPALNSPSAIAAPSATDNTGHSKSKKAGKKPGKATEPDEKEPDVASSIVAEYKCELGNSLTVFTNVDDDNHIALKWGKRLHRMDRVATTTGADRFENRRYGLLWIGIPAKSILLDTKSGHQLANECRTAEQLALKNSETPKATVSSSQ